MEKFTKTTNHKNGLVVTGNWLLCTLQKLVPVFVLFVLGGSAATAQTFPSPSKCASKDLDLIETMLRGQSDNSLLPGNRKMKMTITNKTTSDRRSFGLWATLKRYDINGVMKSSQRVFFCVDSVKKNTTLDLFAKDSLYYGADESIVLSNVYTAWSSANGTENCDYLFANTSKIAPNCSYRDSIRVYTGVNARVNLNRAVCDNGKGKIKAAPFGGKGPYNVSVSQEGSNTQTTFTVQDKDSASFDLPPGIYKVTVLDAKYNSSVWTRTVEAPTSISKPTYTVTHPTCTIPRGMITVVSDGTNYTYELKKNADKFLSATGTFADLDSGRYEVIAVRGFCRSSDSTVIGARPKVPGKPQFTVTHPNCTNAKGSVAVSNLEADVAYLLTENGTQKYTTSNGIFSEVDPGDFQVVAAGLMCKSFDSVKVNKQPFVPGKPAKNVTHPNCSRAKGLITITNLDTKATYQIKQNGSVLASNDNGTFDELSDGDYELVALSKGGNCSNSDTARINKRPEIPNKPNKNTEHPNCTNDKGKITLTNAQADVVYTLETISGVQYTADASGIFNDVVEGDYMIMANGQYCKNSDTARVNPQPKTPSAPSVTSSSTPGFCAATGVMVASSTMPNGNNNNLDYSSDDGASWQNSGSFTINAGAASGLKFRARSPQGCVSELGTFSCDPALAGAANMNVNTEQATGKYLGAARLSDPNVTIKTIPNPFSTQLRFVINTPEAGNGVLEIYNTQGQKLKTIYQGYINAGTNFFDLTLPERRRAELIYVLRMADKTVSGKLIQMSGKK